MFVLNAWYVIAWADEVKDQPLGRTVCNEAVVLYRDRITQRVAALQDRCIHRGFPLRFGRIVDEGIQCGYHGLQFDCSGACVAIPGQTKIPAKAVVRSFPVVERDQLIWIWMGDPGKADSASIVDCFWHNDQEKWPHKHEVYNVKADYRLLVDNLMDLTHLGYVHTTTIGGNPKAHTEAEMKVSPKETGLHFIRWLMNIEPPPSFRKAVPTFKGRVDRWMDFEYFAPGAIVQWSGALDVDRDARGNRHQEGGFSARLFHGLTPETETSCFYFWSTANGYRQKESQVTLDLFNEIAQAFKEDKRVVEEQQAMLSKYGNAGLIDIVSDAARIHMRRAVDRMLDQETPAP